jgi:putative transcriptional regulator
VYKSKLRYFMADAKIRSIKECSKETGLGYSTLIKFIYDEKLDTVKLGTIQILCDYFHCKLSDMIEYIPEDSSEKN